MKAKKSDIIMQNRVFGRIAVGTGLLLLIPLVAAPFISGMDWSLFDFIIMGILIFGTGSTYVLIARKLPGYRFLIGFLLLMVFLLVWGELAVGIFGTPFAGD